MARIFALVVREFSPFYIFASDRPIYAQHMTWSCYRMAPRSQAEVITHQYRHLTRIYHVQRTPHAHLYCFFC